MDYIELEEWFKEVDKINKQVENQLFASYEKRKQEDDSNT